MFCPNISDVSAQKKWEGFWKSDSGSEVYFHLFIEASQMYAVIIKRTADYFKRNPLKEYGVVEFVKVSFDLGKPIERGSVNFYSQPKVYLQSLDYEQPYWLTEDFTGIEGYRRYLKKFDMNAYVENANKIKNNNVYDRCYNVGEYGDDDESPWIYEQLCVLWTDNIETVKQKNVGLTIPNLIRTSMEEFVNEMNPVWGTKEEKLCYLNPFKFEREHKGDIPRLSHKKIFGRRKPR